MEIIVSLLMLVFVLLLGFGALAWYRSTRHYKKQIERSLKMVPYLVSVPQNLGEEKNQGTRDERELAKEMISQAENIYMTVYSTYQKYFKGFLDGQKHMAFEIVAQKGEIYFYIAVPIGITDMIQKAINSQYPSAVITEAEEHNIFFQNQNIENIYGGEFVLKKNPLYPLKTYQIIDLDPMESITNALSKLEEHEGAAVQVLIRPVNGSKFASGARTVASKMQKGEYSEFKTGQAISKIGTDMWDTAMGTQSQHEHEKQNRLSLTPIQEDAVKRIETKAGKPVFDTVIRVIISANSSMRGNMIQNEVVGAFQQYNDFNLNQLKFRKAKDKSKLAADYIFRFHKVTDLFGYYLFHFLNKEYKAVLNSEELASIFHLPNYLVKTPGIKWLLTRQTSAPVTTLPTEGTILGESNFRGQINDVRLDLNDKRRHVYIIGQTGTGKTNTLKNMILDDINRGAGVCYIDPHGQDLEDIISKIPKERAEDVVIFDAGDTTRPIGLNLFEAKTIEEQDFVIQETIGMLYKLYDPGHTGIMGPRFEHWFRNAALTIMADPNGGTFIEVPKIFTDDNYMKDKLQFVKDPVVRNFWLQEMAQTADFHKSEMLGWFVGKFGAFMTNTTMRNILGQVDSGLKIREAMDSGKIVLVNLAKGRVGELNMQLLGMIIVMKFQMAAMSRIDTPEDQRRDFTLYVDEFQNFATDSFASILSEARKFRLSLVVANQFIGQLKEEIRDAVFGNVGTLLCFRIGPEDGEFMEKQFTPVFKMNDLINIENYHAFIKLMVNGIPTRPFTIKGKKPMGVTNPEVGGAIKQLSSLKYGRAREVVDREILGKMGMTQAEKFVPETIPEVGQDVAKQ